MSLPTFLRRTLILAASLTAFETLATKTVYVPAFCEPEDLQISAQNTSLSNQTFWIQKRVAGNLSETAVTVPASQTVTLPGEPLFGLDESLSLKTHADLDLKLKAACKDVAEPLLSDLVTPEVFHTLPSDLLTITVSLMNLNHGSQKIALRFLSSTGVVLKTENVVAEKYYDTLRLKYEVPSGTARFEVRGTGRLHSWIFAQSLTKETFQSATTLGPVPLEPPTTKGAFFLVAPRQTPVEESFVVQITDEALLQKAREQIQTEGFPKIVVARIQTGHGGVNRSFARKDKAPFSWSVSQVDALADFAYIDCDGSPELIEESLQQRLNEGGRICFWRYRIVRELSFDEVREGSLRKP